MVACCPTMSADKLRADQIGQFQDLFGIFDTDKDGQVSGDRIVGRFFGLNIDLVLFQGVLP